MNIAFLGGSFNPPHIAHQLACLILLETEGFDQVWLAPCYRHAFSKKLVNYRHRVRMCRLLAKPFGNRVRVSEVERKVLYRGVNRTRHTLEYLSLHYPRHKFWLIIGSDLLKELPQWKDFPAIMRKFPILVIRRSGHPPSGSFRCTDIELPAVSSTYIRQQLAECGTCSGLVPRSVLDYIQRYNLYRT